MQRRRKIEQRWIKALEVCGELVRSGHELTKKQISFTKKMMNKKPRFLARLRRTASEE